MKKITILIITIFIVNFGFCQDKIQNKAKVSINVNSISADSVQYIFVSNPNFYIDEFKAPLKANRCKHFFPNVVSVNIDFTTQIVSFIFSKALTKDEILKLISHFKYVTYEII